VAFLEEGRDGRGEYLVIEHLWTRPGMMAGPHWHPVLAETFRVREGRMRFRVDGEEFVLGASGEVTVSPGQVHRFWNEGGGLLRVVHEVRPPGHHREMFELWNRLDLAGKTNRQGVPKDPLALGLLWELQDGYLAGIPAPLQRLVFGGLARLARLGNYEERLTGGPAHDDERVWSRVPGEHGRT
jgi:mannose-6-phosphate isomerase-like protein (cupin superfamily)